MESNQELLAIADRLEATSRPVEFDDLEATLSKLEYAANQIGKSFSGSWLGYHSRVYFRGLSVPPAGEHFSQEWGFDNPFDSAHTRGWMEYNPDEVRAAIYELAGGPSLDAGWKIAEAADRQFDKDKGEIISILTSELELNGDKYLEDLKSDLDGVETLSTTQLINAWSPKGQIMTRDTLALGQGFQGPPHIRVLAEGRSIRQSFAACAHAAQVARKAGSHIERVKRRHHGQTRIGTNVFIGHGRSAAWRELKDFVQDRLRLPWDEFNRVPVAGITNIARLSEMLDSAAIAFVIMTAEDELADGEFQARMNVIHEVGLFQGRLGFTKAIVLLEDTCKEFTNIQGLGQIRFPKGKISAAFEDVRAVVEREGLVKS